MKIYKIIIPCPKCGEYQSYYRAYGENICKKWTELIENICKYGYRIQEQDYIKYREEQRSFEGVCRTIGEGKSDLSYLNWRK